MGQLQIFSQKVLRGQVTVLCLNDKSCLFVLLNTVKDTETMEIHFGLLVLCLGNLKYFE